MIFPPSPREQAEKLVCECDALDIEIFGIELFIDTDPFTDDSGMSSDQMTAHLEAHRKAIAQLIADLRRNVERWIEERESCKSK